MFVGSPAWIGMLVLGTLSVALAERPPISSARMRASRFSCSSCVMWFAPKTADRDRYIVAAADAPHIRRHRVSSSISSLKLCSPSCCVPIMWFGHTIFLIGLLFGREIGWIGQTRDDHAVPLRAGAAQPVAAHAARMRRDRLARADASGGDPLCAVPRRRAGAGDTARRRHRTAVARRNVRAHRHRPPARGDRAAARTLRAGAAGHRVRGAAAAAGLKLFHLIYRIAPDPWLTSEFLL